MSQSSALSPRPVVPWYREPTREQWSAWMAGFLGWILDAFDFTVFLLVIKPIADDFHLPIPVVATVFTITIYMRFVGATLSGWAADRWGRRLPLMVSIATFSLCNFLAGFSPNFAVLFILRLVLGIGMGGEWPAGAALAMEHWPIRSRGLFSGMLQGGWGLGYLLAAIAYAIIFPLWGWRAMFWIGVLPALLIVYIRFGIKEPEVWREAKAQQTGPSRPWYYALSQMFGSSRMTRRTIMAMLWMCMNFLLYYSITSLFPTHLQQDFKWDAGQVATALIGFNIMTFLGMTVAGIIADRIGRRATVVIGALGGLAIAPIYLFSNNLVQVTVGYAIQGALGGGALYAILPTYLAELYPTEIRSFAAAITYHVGTLLGGPVPVVLSQLALFGLFGISATGLAVAMMGGIAIGGVLCLVFISQLPETKGQDLATVSLDKTPARPAVELA